MQMPIVNMNGTSVGELKKQALEALHASQKADKALRAMAPNGRDYQTDHGALTRAQSWHQDRLHRQELNTRELEEIVLYLVGVEDEQQARRDAMAALYVQQTDDAS